jgi:hypothetical protein
MKVCHHQPRKFPLLIRLISFILKLSSAYRVDGILSGLPPPVKVASCLT